MLFKNKKKPLTQSEKACLDVLKNNPSCKLKLRKGNKVNYTLYTADSSPICGYARNIIENLIEKEYIDYTPSTGVFIIL